MPSPNSSRSSSTMDEDKQYLLHNESGATFPLKRRARGFLSWNLVFLLGNIVLLACGLATWGRIHILLRSFECNSEPKKMHFEADLEYDTPTTFQPHSFYGGIPRNETNEMWQRLAPPGDGIVEIPNEYASHLPVSLPAPNNPKTHKVYGVSMFHQLHCLNFLRFAYYPDTVVDFPPDEVVLHRDHCLDYIRQAIMCAGDSTFEPLTKAGINGMGATHQCRNFDRMWSWAYDNRDNKEKGTGYGDAILTHSPGHRNEDLSGSHGH